MTLAPTIGVSGATRKQKNSEKEKRREHAKCFESLSRKKNLFVEEKIEF
jgi:hypothetical protein